MYLAHNTNDFQLHQRLRTSCGIVADGENDAVTTSVRRSEIMRRRRTRSRNRITRFQMIFILYQFRTTAHLVAEKNETSIHCYVPGVSTSFRKEFSKKTAKCYEERKNSRKPWKFVYSLAKQCRSYNFHLTNLFQKKFQILMSLKIII